MTNLNRIKLSKLYRGHSLYSRSKIPGRSSRVSYFVHIVQPRYHMIAFKRHNSLTEIHSVPLPYQIWFYKFTKSYNDNIGSIYPKDLFFAQRHPVKHPKTKMFTPYLPNIYPTMGANNAYSTMFCLGSTLDNFRTTQKEAPNFILDFYSTYWNSNFNTDLYSITNNDNSCFSDYINPKWTLDSVLDPGFIEENYWNNQQIRIYNSYKGKGVTLFEDFIHGIPNKEVKI